MNLREVERESIRTFLLAESRRFDGGRVLDYGAGKQPYRELIETAGGDYVPFDRDTFPGSTADDTLPDPIGLFDVVVCTQVIQYVPHPDEMVRKIYYALKRGGELLMTGPTNWPVVEKEDLWRFTVPGITRLLTDARFAVEVVYERAHVEHAGERWPLGWAAVATAR